MNNKCDKGWHNGECCCNCKNHYKDMHHCNTEPKPLDYDKNNHKCVCSIQKGWICLISFEGERPHAYSGWGEHGYCEFYKKCKQ